MRFFHECFERIGLKDFHKNKSVTPQFSNDFNRIPIDDLNEFYSAPEIPSIEFTEETQKSNYSIGRFKFQSAISTGDASNDYASGTYHLNNDSSNENINCIIVHGWRMDDLSLIFNMFGDNFINEGCNSFYYTLPHHFERQTKESMFSGELMVGSNIDRTLLSIKQSVSDIRALIYWLRENKKGKIVLIGISLGGLITNLTSAVESNLDALISLIYANSLAYSVWYTNVGIHIKKEYMENNITYEDLKKYWKIITPDYFMPVIPKERILLMSGIYDKFVHIQDTNTVWEAWGRPKRLVYKCGHSGIILKRKKIYKEVISLIKQL